MNHLAKLHQISVNNHFRQVTNRIGIYCQIVWRWNWSIPSSKCEFITSVTRYISVDKKPATPAHRLYVRRTLTPTQSIPLVYF